MLAAGSRSISAQTTSASTFRVFLRGVDIGIEEVTVFESPDGWTLRGRANWCAPINLSMDYWEARYDRTWKPIELTVNLTERPRSVDRPHDFNGTTASSEVTQDGQTATPHEHGGRRHHRSARSRLRRVRSAGRETRVTETGRASFRCSSHRKMPCP